MRLKNGLIFLAIFLSIAIRAEMTPVKFERYYAGALVGSVFGFGVGHAIQERYKEIGWVFTLGELSSLSVILAGSIWANNAADALNKAAVSQGILPG